MVKLITRGIDSMFSTLRVGAHENAAGFHALILLINIIVSIYPLVCYYLLASNIHVVFWMGTSPQVVNLLVPCAMTALNGGVVLFQCCNMRAGTAKIGCFTLFFCVGFVLVCGGAYVLKISDDVATDLTYNCGATKMTEKIQVQWEKLHAFYDACAEKEGERPDLIQQCPGFEKLFENNVYVKYIQDMEYDYDCQGFCRFWSRPLFNPDSNPGIRCASAIAEDVTRVGDLSGTPTVAQGVIIMLLGILLSGYDHL